MPDTVGERDQRVVELRVHGVSGGEAEELLDVEPAMRVSGDRQAGFFRWRGQADTETVPGVPREIFAWGNLTSGRSSRALWLLLLPFILVNIAYWMRPGRQDDHPSRAHRLADSVYGTCVRLLSVSLTALITLAAAGVTMDLIGWQCSGYGQRCAELRPLLGFLSAPDAALAEPGRALAVGAVVPLGVVVVLWRLSRRTGSVFEVATPPSSPAPRPVAPLSDPAFWRNSETMGRLRSAHIAVAVGVVAGLLLVPALRRDTATGDPGAGLVLAAVLAAVLTLSTVSVLVPGTDPRWNRRADLACSTLRDLSLVLLGSTAIYTLWPRPGWEADGRLPGYADALNTLFAAQCVLGAVLLLAAVVLYRGNRAHDDIAMRGVAGPAAAALGALLGGVFSAAVVYQSAGWLGGCYYPSAAEQGCLLLRPPSAYSWLQLAFTMEAVIALAVAAVLMVLVRRRTRHQIGVTASLYDRPPDARRTREIARARALGGMTEVLPACLAAFLLPAVALVALVLYAVVSGRLTAVPGAGDGAEGGPVSVTAEATAWVQNAITIMVTVGSFLGGLALLTLVLVGRSAYRDRPTRQALGVLWDIGTFWPRVAHPLAPPCYAERAVPQLVARVTGMANRGVGVVLSGHSQGSVLAAATVCQVPAGRRPAVALLTHGSPLYRLYARYFPAYFGPAALGVVRERVTHWHNLWRVTDAIGGRIHLRRGEHGASTVASDSPLPDPRHYDVRPGEAVHPEILGHSFYTRDPAYAEVLADAAGRVAAGAEERGTVTAEVPRQPAGVEPAGEALPGAVGAVGAADTAHGGADVEQEDQGGDERQEGERRHEAEGAAQGDEGPHAEQAGP